MDIMDHMDTHYQHVFGTTWTNSAPKGQSVTYGEHLRKYSDTLWTLIDLS